MPTEPRLEIRNDTGRQEYRAVLRGGDGERVVGTAAYRKTGSQTTFTHTEVEDDMRGHGIGTELVGAALDDVRDHGGTAIPQCPFVAHVVREHADYLAVVAPDARAAVAADG